MSSNYVYWAVTWNIFMLGSVIAIYLYRHHPYFKKRMVNVVMVTTLTATWNGNISLVGLNLWKSKWPFPCWVRILQQVLHVSNLCS